MSDSRIILADEDIRRSGYGVDPFDAAGRYVGAPLVRVALPAHGMLQLFIHPRRASDRTSTHRAHGRLPPPESAPVPF
jgi:hypothetical protein